MRLPEQIDALREAGADRAQPVQLRHIEGLAARLADAPEAVQPLLEQKIRVAVQALRARLDAEPVQDAGADDCQPGAPGTARPGDDTGTAPCDSLGRLNRHALRAADRVGDAAADAARAAQAHAPDELPSARRFREAWGRMRADEDIETALRRGPADAGPLNSHRLMLRSLLLMRELSPDYLQRFLSLADALLWLERGRARNGVPPRGDAG